MSDKANHSKTNQKRWIVILAVILVAAVLSVAVWWLVKSDTPNGDQPEHTQTTGESTGTHSPDNNTSDENEEYTDMGQGLIVSKVHKYAGMYMEDGTNEVVSGAMMVIFRNSSQQDLQLARLKLTYADFVAEFEVTNIPAGESVVALEKNRREYTEKAYQNASVEDVIFFSEPMSLREDQLKISGGEGYLDVKNITDKPIKLVYVYYKNSASDILYGGITYRTKIADGIQPGETLRVAAGHYSPENCRIMMVQIEENVIE